MKEVRHEHQNELIFCDEAVFYQSPEYQRYREAWNTRPVAQDHAEWPVNLDVSVTNNCNLGCTMCKRTIALEDGDAWRSGELINPTLQYLDFEVYKKVIDEGAENGLFAVHLTGHDGEPTMHKELPEMIHHARARGLVDVFTHSNATLLHKQDREERILEAQPHRIVFSVESPVKETYESIRVGANFERVVENIGNFIKRKKTLGLVFPIVKVQMVVMKKNAEEVNQFKELFRDELGADVLGFTEYIDYHEIITDSDAGVDHAVDGVYNNHYVCDQPYRRIRLDQSGLVYSCLIGQFHELGDARTTTIKEMWKGPYQTKLREAHLAVGAGKTPGCETCGRQWTAEKLVVPTNVKADVTEIGYEPYKAVIPMTVNQD